jgi:cytochrome P450
VVEAALEWFPERWLEPRKPPAFYHLSGGAQSCSGADIARFIGVHVLAELLAEREFQALYPRIVNERRLPAAYNAFAIHLAVVDASA